MAPRSKPPSKFTGPLEDPIVIPFELPAFDQPFEIKPHGLKELTEKLFLLSEHYGLKHGDWFNLAFNMAIDLVPGFQLVYDDSLAAFLGFPTKGGSKSGRAGTGKAPMFEGDRLLKMIDFMKIAGHEKGLWQTDRGCAEYIFESSWPKPLGRPCKKDREAGINTIARRIREAKQNRDGPAEIVRGRSKSK